MLGFTAAETSVRAVQTLAKTYEDRAEDYTRAAERTDDPVFRNILLMLALQWRLAAQEETSKSSEICRRNQLC
jgi:hypothetical protein